MGSIQNLIVPFLIFSFIFGMQNIWFGGNLTAQNRTENITSLTQAQVLINKTNDVSAIMQNESQSGAVQIVNQFAVFLGIFVAAAQYFVLQATIGTLVTSLGPMLEPVFGSEFGFVSAFVLVLLAFKFVMQYIKLVRGLDP